TASAQLSPDTSFGWKPLRIGAGGYVTGLDIAPDGTMAIRCDTYGGYFWGPGGKGRRQNLNKVSNAHTWAFAMPQRGSAGLFEIRIAPSSSDIMFMMYANNLFKTTNKGATWSRTGFAAVKGCDSNDGYKINNQKIAIDPHNPDVVVVGTTLNGLF